MHKRCTSWPPGVLWWVFFPKPSIDFARKISSLFVLLIATVFSGHSPFLCHTWVIPFASFFVYVELSPFGIKLGLIYVQKVPVSTWSCMMHVYTKERPLTKGQTWMVWFLSRGWSKAGWLVIGTQSIMSPSSLFKKYYSENISL